MVTSARNRRLAGLLHYVDNLNEWGGKLCAFLVYAMVGVLMWEIVLRYVFNNPTEWAHEGSLFIFGAYFMLGGGYVLRHHGHVRVDVLESHFPVRMRAIKELTFTYPLLFLFAGVMLVRGLEAGWASLIIRETTSTPWAPPLYVLRLTVPIGAALILLQGIAEFIRNLSIAITGRKLANEH